MFLAELKQNLNRKYNNNNNRNNNSNNNNNKTKPKSPIICVSIMFRGSQFPVDQSNNALCSFDDSSAFDGPPASKSKSAFEDHNGASASDSVVDSDEEICVDSDSEIDFSIGECLSRETAPEASSSPTPSFPAASGVEKASYLDENFPNESDKDLSSPALSAVGSLMDKLEGKKEKVSGQ